MDSTFDSDSELSSNNDLVVHRIRSMICDIEDKHVRRMVADAKYNAKVDSWPTVDCVLFGSSCNEAVVVPVPVQSESLKSARFVDVAFRSYVNAPTSRYSTSFCLDRYMIHVDRYPIISPIIGEYQYTIFTSRNPSDAVNTLVKSYHGMSDKEVLGSILVVRSDREGFVRPIADSDKYFVQTMLVEILYTRYREFHIQGAADLLVRI